MKRLLFMTFFVCYVALVLSQDQLMTSLETLSNALFTPTYRLVDELDKNCQKQCPVNW